jgi:hypothetical protein
MEGTDERRERWAHRGGSSTCGGRAEATQRCSEVGDELRWSAEGGVVGAWSTGKLRGVRHGGNLGGNLGEVELTVRLRRRQWRLQNLCDFAEGGGGSGAQVRWGVLPTSEEGVGVLKLRQKRNGGERGMGRRSVPLLAARWRVGER